MKLIILFGGLYVLLNLVSFLYYKFGDHRWNSYGYGEHHPLGSFTKAVNIMMLVVIGVSALSVGLTWAAS